MDKPLASVRFGQTVDDVVALHVRIATRPAMVDEVRRRSLRSLVVTTVLVAPVVAGALWLLTSDPRRRAVSLVMFGVLAMFFLVRGAIKVGSRAGARASIERTTRELVRSGKVPVTLGDNEVAIYRGWCEASDGSTRVEKMWEAGATVHDDPEGVFIEWTDGTVMMAPRRAFAGDAERERFVGVARGLAGK